MPIVVSIIFATLFFVALWFWFRHQSRKPEKNPPFKVGLDIHGVSDAAPEFFSHLSQLFMIAGCEVHIITGAEITPELEQQLHDLGICYTHIFSITDYHKSIGTQVDYKSPGNPIINEVLWDSTKADYCRRENIGMMIDDSPVYGQYFSTPYMHVNIKKFPKN